MIPCGPIVTPGTTKLLWDALADAEIEVMKLRKLLVLRTCNCRPLCTTLPLEPVMHKKGCEYRKLMS